MLKAGKCGVQLINSTSQGISEMNVRILEQRLSDECGCPEEDLEIGMCFFTVHLEPDEKGGHIFCDLGDYGQAERLVDCDNIEQLRQHAHDWAVEIHEKGLDE